MIDPTCGSGHFLLGGFARLFDLWMKRENNEIVAAQKALDGVWGVDMPRTTTSSSTEAARSSSSRPRSLSCPPDATEDDHLALLGLLNSSTACFWMKQTFHNKGSTVDQHCAPDQRTDAFERLLRVTPGRGCKRFPVPRAEASLAVTLSRP